MLTHNFAHFFYQILCYSLLTYYTEITGIIDISLMYNFFLKVLILPCYSQTPRSIKKTE